MLYFSEDFKGPLAIRYPRGGDSEDFKEKALTRFIPGVFEVLREGADGYLYATGKMVARALILRERLKEEGLDFGVVNGCFVKPVDEKLIRKHLVSGKYIITMEDNMVHGGFGSMILESGCESGGMGRILRLGFKDSFVVQGPVETLYEAYGLGLEEMTKKILGFVGDKNE